MSLPFPANCNPTWYRAASVSNPYTFGTLVGATFGYLMPAIHDGRYGTALYLNWTHILYLSPGAANRAAYNAQLDPSRNTALAALVAIDDSTTGTHTAYYVAVIELIGRGTAQEQLRVYRERLQPASWPTDAI